MSKSIPIVSFLIPFSSKKVKKDWCKASNHLRQTLESIRGSLNPNFTVVVIGNEKPDFDIEFDSRFKFLSLNHNNFDCNEIISARKDIIIKLQVGFQYVVSTWSPMYVMRCDSDDLISNRLVEWMVNAPSAPGYLISRGWVWDESRYFIEYSETHDRICGTCLVVRTDYAIKEGPFLTNVDCNFLDKDQITFAKNNQSAVVPGAKNGFILFHNAHQRHKAYFEFLGHNIKSLPFPAVIYRICNTDSLSNYDTKKGRKYTIRQYLGRLKRLRVISQKLINEFSLKV